MQSFNIQEGIVLRSHNKSENMCTSYAVNICWLKSSDLLKLVGISVYYTLIENYTLPSKKRVQLKSNNNVCKITHVMYMQVIVIICPTFGIPLLWLYVLFCQSWKVTMQWKMWKGKCCLNFDAIFWYVNTIHCIYGLKEGDCKEISAYRIFLQPLLLTSFYFVVLDMYTSNSSLWALRFWANLLKELYILPNECMVEDLYFLSTT